MTGYGHGEAADDRWTVTAELSGVNRKQTDIAINLPSSLNELEGEVRKQIADRLSRGRVNARITLERRGGGTTTLLVDEGLARQYVEAARQVSEATGADLRMAAADLFRAPGVFRIDEAVADPDAVRGLVIHAVEVALSHLIAMQEEEGAHLRRDLEARLDTIERHMATVRDQAPEVVESHRRHLHARLASSGLTIDMSDERLLREMALYAERCDVSEELTRIGSHLAQFRRYLEGAEPAGRPLDFLCQELNREFNTIGSKANDAGIAQRVVDAKTELEKIREQIQNLQ